MRAANYLSSTLLCLWILLASRCKAFSSPNMSRNNKKIIASITSMAQKELKILADPEKAKKMQGYCKTTMPMYGIQKPDRARVEKMIHTTLQEQNVTITLAFYRDCIKTFWKLPKREEKYLAIDFALKYKEHIVWEILPLYENFLIRENHDIMWWDFLGEEMFLAVCAAG